MKKMLCSILLGIICFSTVSRCEEKKTLAVLDLQALEVPQSYSIILTDRIRHEIFQTAKYIVLERSVMDEIFKEYGFQESGCVSSECLVEAGRLLGVEYMVAGSLSKIGNLYTIVLRMIEVETGTVVATSIADLEGPIERVAVESTHEAVLKLIAPSAEPQIQVIIPTQQVSNSQGGSTKKETTSWVILLSIVVGIVMLAFIQSPP